MRRALGRSGRVVSMVLAMGLAVMLVGLPGQMGRAAPAPLNVIVIVKATNSQYWQYVFAGAKQAVHDLGLRGATSAPPPRATSRERSRSQKTRSASTPRR